MNRSHRLGVEEWRPIIDGQRSSGSSVAAYCRDRGITEGTFYTWKRKLRATPTARPNRLPTPTFVEVKPSSLPASEAIELCLPNERRLLVRRGFDRDLLIELVRALEGMA